MAGLDPAIHAAGHHNTSRAASSSLLAFVVGLRAEARLLHGHVFVGGGDTPGAAQASARAIKAGATALVSFGLAGGLAPSLRPGTLIIPRHVLRHGRSYAVHPALARALGGETCEAVLSLDGVVVNAADKLRLMGENGAHAVDLESGAVALAASDAGIPFAVLRAVCDPAERTLPPAALAALNTKGAVGIHRVLGSLARQPGQLGALLALARDAAQARRALVRHMAGLRASRALVAWE